VRAWECGLPQNDSEGCAAGVRQRSHTLPLLRLHFHCRGILAMARGTSRSLTSVFSFGFRQRCTCTPSWSTMMSAWRNGRPLNYCAAPTGASCTPLEQILCRMSHPGTCHDVEDDRRGQRRAAPCVRGADAVASLMAKGLG